MMETTRYEYRACALDPEGDEHHYYGEIRPTAHQAHLSLEESWEIDDREVVVEKRTVKESEWVKLPT